jgi:hypothetical protein
MAVAQDRLPTYSESHEMSTLSSMMFGLDYVESAKRLGLKVEHFFRPAHRTVCKIILELRDQNKPPELQFILDKLGDDVRNIGGAEYLDQIAEHVPSPANLEFYAREVITHWSRNELARIGNMAHDPDASMDVLRARMEGAFQGLAAPGAKVVSPLSPNPEMQRKRGVKTYVQQIDRSTSVYGLPVGQFGLIAAYTKVGKTALMRQIAVNVARNGGRVLYGLFADLTKVEFEGLVMKNLTGYAYTPDSGDGFEALQAWDAAIKEIEIGWDFDVYDTQELELEGAENIETFAAYALREHARRPYDLVCLDYAQEITTREIKGGGDDVKTGNVCSRKVRALARKLDTAATLVASQVTEGGKERRDITKGSRTWEERAGYVLYLQRPEDNQDMISANVRFQRFGKGNLKWTWDWDESRLEVR